MNNREEIYLAERRHLDDFWPGRRAKEFRWGLGPISETLPEFRVRQVAPLSPDQPWVYVSVGAWEATDSSEESLEFMLESPVESTLHVELMAMVANFHADPEYRLGVGRTMNIGRPWLEGSASCHLLVSLPYSYGPAFEHCLTGTTHLRFLWIVPITEGEAKFRHENGLEALEQRFEAAAVDTLDPHRRPVV